MQFFFCQYHKNGKEKTKYHRFMKDITQPLTFDYVIQSFKEEFDSEERNRIIERLKKSDQIEEESLIGLKLFLESNNWDHRIVTTSVEKVVRRIDTILKANNENK